MSDEILAHVIQERNLLREALVRYGDRVPMATCSRPDLQQVIDDAFANVPIDKRRGRIEVIKT